MSPKQAMAVLGLVALLATAPLLARAEGHGRGFVERTRDVVADLTLARPLGLVQLVTGAALLPVIYPHAILTHTDVDVVEICLFDPARQTFTRPLGEL